MNDLERRMQAAATTARQRDSLDAGRVLALGHVSDAARHLRQAENDVAKAEVALRQDAEVAGGRLRGGTRVIRG